jgi:hypothetical protein
LPEGHGAIEIARADPVGGQASVNSEHLAESQKVFHGPLSDAKGREDQAFTRSAWESALGPSWS